MSNPEEGIDDCRIAKGVQLVLALFLRRRLLPHLSEVVFDVALDRDQNLVAVDFAGALRMLHAALRVRRLQHLAGGLHFDRRFAADVLGALADPLADLAHGGQLLGLADGLVPSWLPMPLPGCLLAW
jgi:hypothetical protein